ncbi:AAA family ATPase [Dysgonomonas mossii]|uniref:nSTAND1 domain-containing NTPase n=1 Tax=Dysgonomonas mossii TaxID=163665 RepID=UPI003993DA7A
MDVLDLDTFGEDERRISKSGVRHIFTPHKPIDDERIFKGRGDEMKQILSTLNTPGQHALLYGDRGVGKSSLANIAAQHLVKITKQKLIIKRCDSSDTFLSIVESALDEVGFSPRTKSITSQKGINVPLMQVGLSYGNTIEKDGYMNQSFSPSWVSSKIKDLDALLLIDEFDAVQGVENKFKIAELIKQLSDSNAKLKILIVGIAESASELTEGHPSVQRCLKEIKLNRMKYDELAQVIRAGAYLLSLTFEKDVIYRIVRLSSGYAYFTHLLALKASEEAIIDERNIIRTNNLNFAIEKAINDCESSLQQLYERSIQSSIERYKKILYAVSLCNDEFIRNKDIKIKYENKFGEPLSQSSLRSCISKIVSNSNDKILKRIYKGVYRFSDPRMASYIRIAQAYMYTVNEDVSLT